MQDGPAVAEGPREELVGLVREQQGPVQQVPGGVTVRGDAEVEQTVRRVLRQIVPGVQEVAPEDDRVVVAERVEVLGQRMETEREVGALRALAQRHGLRRVQGEPGGVDLVAPSGHPPPQGLERQVDGQHAGVAVPDVRRGDDGDACHELHFPQPLPTPPRYGATPRPTYTAPSLRRGPAP